MDPGLVAFDALPDDEARERLRACCAARAWVDAMLAGRPFGQRAEVRNAAAEALAALDWDGVREALDAHPRIGERVAAQSREAAWSVAEQSGMDSSSAATRAALVEANRAYEERFGHVFLIFATGKTDQQMLAAARERLHHDAATEQETVRSELEKIVLLRIDKLLDQA
jgi:2-oxo-4-hydroxy-4-carboxy-5-ureidoimidazoline decarboxylase